MTESISGASPLLLLEYWKPVVGFEDFYEISNTGRVFSIRNSLQRRAFDDTRGYLNVTLSVDGKHYNRRVHRMVTDAFIGSCPTSMERNHKDGNKQNNRQSNLEFVTRQRNVLHAIALGLFPDSNSYTTAAHQANQTITEADVRRIREEQGRGIISKFANEFDLNPSTIYKIRRRVLWKHVA